MIRNLLTTLLRFKLSSTLNLLGLSIAFASFTIIVSQVYYEYTFGTVDRDADRIYLLETQDGATKKWGRTALSPLGNTLVESYSSEVEATARMLMTKATPMIEREGEKIYYEKESVLRLHEDPSRVFEFTMVAGTMASVMDAGNAVLSQSQAHKFFGDDDPMGRKINLMGSDYTVSGVYRDLPSRSILPNAICVGLSSTQMVQLMFVKLRQGVDQEALIANYAKMDKQLQYGLNPSKDPVRLQNIADCYFAEDSDYYYFLPRGNRATTNILLAISVLIILIAAINFINFATAMAPVRIQGLNTRMVFGATIGTLRRNMIFEGFAISALAFALALCLILWFNETQYDSLLRIDSTAISNNLPAVTCCAAVALLVGLISGIYPAYYCTRFTPALVLKGSGGHSASGRLLRSTLIGVQYVISIVLIIFAVVVKLQNQTLLNAPLGFDKANLLCLDVDDEMRERVAQRLESIPGVIGTSGYNGSFGEYEADQIWDMIIGGDTVRINGYMVDHKFTELMKIPIIEGRGLSKEDSNREKSEQEMITNVVMNRTAARMYGMKIDSIVGSGYAKMRVVGITEDYISQSAVENVVPTCLHQNDYMYALMIRIDGRNTSQTIAAINSAIKELIPEQSPTVQFYDEIITKLYDKERDLATFITIFSILAIVIALFGVFGLVVFETQYRRKEIGLRRINGATVGKILVMFNRKFVLLIIACFAIAAPLAWYGVGEWLMGFAIKALVEWWVYALALLIVLTITILTVTIQSCRSATENPVKSIKSE